MAVTYSKLSPKSVSEEEFKIICTEDVKCSQIMHKGVDSCLMASYYMAKGSLVGSARFFVPMYLVQLVVSSRNLNKQTLQEIALGFCRSIVFGTSMATGFLSSSCLFHRLLGRYTYYFGVLVPGAIGGISVFIDDPKRRAIFLNTYLNLALEYLVTTNGWRLPRLQETSVFMLISALLMYQLRTAANRSNLFWFFVPPRRAIQVLGECCPHTGPCWKDILKGGAKYAGLAVVLQLAKTLLSVGVKRPKKIKEKLFSKSTVKLSLSLGGYVFIYKVVSCFLCKRFGGDRPIFAAIAGLFAGSVYAVQPRIEAMCSAVVVILKLLLRRSGRNNSAFLAKIHAVELILVLCNGILFHARCMDAANCPSFIVTMMDTASNQRSKEIYNEFVERHHRAIAEGKLSGHSKKDAVNTVLL